MPVDIGPAFCKFPNKLFGSGVAAELGHVAALVYLALCECANREFPHSSNTFTVSDRSIAADTGYCPRLISSARRKLIAVGLVSCQREKGCSFVYTLIPQTFRSIPRKQRLRPKKKPRALHGTPRGVENLIGTHAKYATPFGRIC